MVKTREEHEAQAELFLDSLRRILLQDVPVQYTMSRSANPMYVLGRATGLAPEVWKTITIDVVGRHGMEAATSSPDGFFMVEVEEKDNPHSALWVNGSRYVLDQSKE